MAPKSITFNFNAIASGVGLILTLINGWVLLAVKSATDDVTKMREAQNAATVTSTAMAVKIDAFTSNIAEIRSDQRNVNDKTTALTIDLAANKALTQKAVDNADAAYKEANTVNGKIERLGLQLVGGGKLNAKDK